MHRTFINLSGIVLAVSGALMGTCAFAHGKLENSTPRNGAALDSSPAEVRLTFSEPIEPTLSSVKVVGANDAPVGPEKARVGPADAKTIVLAMPHLAAGAYRAQWAVVGADGHRVKGQIGFTVK